MGALSSAMCITTEGGGGSAEINSQPHAKGLEHAPCAPVAEVWSENPSREPLPVSVDPRPEAVPHARGK